MAMDGLKYIESLLLTTELIKMAQNVLSNNLSYFKTSALLQKPFYMFLVLLMALTTSQGVIEVIMILIMVV